MPDGPARRLVLILGDQLSSEISSLRGADPRTDVVLMAEVHEEAHYVPHHKKKIAFIFSAMRHFARALRDDGWPVDYVDYTKPGNTGTLKGEVKRALERHEAKSVTVTAPGEWRLSKEIEDWQKELGIPVVVRDDDRFLCSVEEFRDWAEGRKLLRLEDFYRYMRRKTGLLMEGEEPAGGRWNFDRDNRKALPADLEAPALKTFAPDALTEEVLRLVDDAFTENFGALRPFAFAVTPGQATEAFDAFLEQRLAQFGHYQDAMRLDSPFLFHSLASLHLNTGLLDPLDICRKVESAYRDGRVQINAAEGFIRQIIGWREFVRGIYWREMPDYRSWNFFDHGRPLPDFYWTGKTDMACIADAVSQTRDEAYAHHIQRLMVTGNFAMIAGIDPAEVHNWYLAVYADAFEWVELPNTYGLSQFADGGLLASKPYAASGRYIDKMSNYCSGCRYDVRQKTGPDACPFNALYWDFVARNRESLKDNPRMRLVYASWDRMADSDKAELRKSAAAFQESLDP